MTTAQETINPQDEAQKIWDQLEAEESGRAQPPSDEPADPPAPAPAPAEPTDPAPAEQADAPQGGDEPAPTGEQVLLDKIAGLEAMLGQVTQRLRNAEGHIGGLGSQLKQQQQVAAQVAAKGGEAPSAGEIRAAQSNPEAMARLKADYPEFADAMESALNERLGALEQQLKQTQQPVQQQGVSPDEIQRLRAEMAVEVRHPGWQDRVQTPEFVGWLQRQPPEVQMLAASESPRDAVRLLDLHSDAMKTVSSQRTQRLSAAAAIPSGRSGGNVRSKAVEDMSPEEYWAYLDQLDRQKGN
jgi:preprotein translocase subunit SecD